MSKHGSHVKATGDGMKRLAELGRALGKHPAVKIGVFADDGIRRDGLSNVEIAIINEFRESVGPDGVGPARSFLRSTYDAKRHDWEKLLERVLVLVIKGKLELKEALELVGQRASADVRNRILHGAGIPPPNAQSTIDRKGSSRPLVDSSQMVNSISYQVKENE